MASLDPGDEVFVEDPGFVSYQPAIRYCGGVPVAVPLPWTPEKLEEKLTSRTRAILMCSRSGPIGRSAVGEPPKLSTECQA